MQKIRAEGVQDPTAPQKYKCLSKDYRNQQGKSSGKGKKDYTAEAKKTAIMLPEAVQYLYTHFRRAAVWRITEHEDGELTKMPSTMRGNKVYAYYQSIRCGDIQDALDSMIEFDNDTTNSLFITLTSQYRPKDAKSVKQSWQAMRKALPAFAAKIRRIIVGYVITVEAHRLGGCHAHAQLVLRRPVGMYEDDKGVYRCANEEIRQKIKQKWADSLGVPIAQAHCDIQAVHDEQAARYLLKELKKVDSCEEAVKRLKGKTYDGELDERQLRKKIKDEKKVLAFYYAIKNKMRMLRTSKNLAKKLEKVIEQEPPEVDLIELCNNSDTVQSRKIIRREIILKRREIIELFRGKKFEPYTGWVESEDEIEIYREMLNRRVPLMLTPAINTD
jgi:hypothetical protein